MSGVKLTLAWHRSGCATWVFVEVGHGGAEDVGVIAQQVEEVLGGSEGFCAKENI